ncbi:MAG: 50S ribosomal protein L17 [Patescibacteria group bacterium]|jgi:large subunit ribosomal protein L17
MRHRKTRPTLDRKAAPRNAMLRQMVASVVLTGRIVSTTAKVRAVQPLVERAVTTAKSNTLAARRQLMRTLPEAAVNKLLTTWGPKFKERKGGYTRRMLIGQRQGDGGHQAMLEFID